MRLVGWRIGELLAEGGTAPYSYTWSSSQITPIIQGLTSGMYTLNVFDSQGCEAIELYEVGCLMDGKLIPNAFISPNGDGANDTWIIENGWQRDDLHLEVFNRWGCWCLSMRGPNTTLGALMTETAKPFPPRRISISYAPSTSRLNRYGATSRFRDRSAKLFGLQQGAVVVPIGIDQHRIHHKNGNHNGEVAWHHGHTPNQHPHGVRECNQHA